MRKFSKLTGILLLIVMLVAMMTGCGMSDEEFIQDGDAMVIIIGNHANANRATEDELKELFGDKLEQCMSRYKDGEEYCLKANVSIIVLDGNPETVDVVFDGEKVELKASAMSVEKVMREQEYIIQDIRDFLLEDSLRANDEEVDMLAAIAEAKIILDQYNRKDMEKHIVIYDSGISTDGFFDMRKNNIQNGTVGQVLERLPDGAKYDLTGITITFGGLGNVAGNQMDLREDSLFSERLSAVWKEYFLSCNVKAINPDENGDFNKINFAPKGSSPMICVEKETDTGEGEPSENVDLNEKDYYHFVSAVPFTLSEKVVGEIIEGKGDTPIILKSVDMGFKGDSAEFKDKEQAYSKMDSYKDVFEEVKKHPEIILYVVGSRAKTTPNEKTLTDDQLSKDRAEAVAKVLRSRYGVPAEQIVIIDAGTQKLSWRNGVEFPGGTWESKDKVAMMNNRVVAIVPNTYADLVQELIDLGEIQ